MFKKISAVVRILVITDFFYNSAFGSLAPVFAIFIVGSIEGGSASVAGTATATYWIVKSLSQLPIARFLDKTDGERDDFWAMFGGYFLSSFIPFGYLFITEPWHLYLLQGLLGFFMAWAIPGWYSIFTRHVDRWRIGFEWSLESVFGFGISTALASAIGGYVVDAFGFQALFAGVGILSLFSSLIFLFARKHIAPTKVLPPRVIPERIHHAP